MMKRFGEFCTKHPDLAYLFLAVAVIIALGLGIYAGHKVTVAYKDIDLMDVRAELETAQAALADANIELAFWKATLRELADGGQINGRISKED